MIPVIFILGAMRSGSSVLERTLGAFAGTVAIGEQRVVWLRGFLENNLCTCRQPFLSCPFWEEVHDRATELDPAFPSAEQMIELGRSADRQRLIPPMHLRRLRTREFEESYDVFSASLVTWYTAIHKAARGAVIIDSTKDPSYAHLLSTIPEFNVGYVHLVRDSRAVAYSQRRPKVRPMVTNRIDRMELLSPTRAAIEWDTKYALSSLLGWLRPERVINMRYDTLVSDTDRMLDSIARLAQKLQMPELGPRSLDVLADRYHSVWGNPNRFDRAMPRFRMDDEWRTKMRWSDRALVTALTFPFLVRQRLSQTSRTTA